MAQRIIVLIAALFLILGSFGLFLPWIELSRLLSYFFVVGISAILMFFAFSRDSVPLGKSSQKSTKRVYPPPSAEINPTLLNIESVWPFEFFPNRLIIDEEDITIVEKRFFFMGWTETIPASEIQDVRMYMGPFLASLSIQKKPPVIKQIEINNLWKKDALRAKELIDGLILENRDLIKIPEKTPLLAKKRIIEQAGKNDQVRKEILEKA